MDEKTVFERTDFPREPTIGQQLIYRPEQATHKPPVGKESVGPMPDQMTEAEFAKEKQDRIAALRKFYDQQRKNRKLKLPVTKKKRS